MSAQIIPFAYEDKLVRSIHRGGEPWFVGKDVCQALGLANTAQALSRLDDDEKGIISSDTPGGVQEVLVVSEAGTFRLIFTSRKEEAERFKRWLAHEVLPALRKTGAYTVPGRAQEILPGAEPVRIEELKLAKVREARLLYGHARARALWESLGLDAIPNVVAPADGAARDCLGIVLDHEIQHNGNWAALRTLIEVGLDDEHVAGMLAAHGVRVDPDGDGFIVANGVFTVEAIFRDSPFSGGRHARVLKRLPGARPWHAQRYGKDTARGVWLPARLLDQE